MPDLTASEPVSARMDQTAALAEEIIRRLDPRTVLDAGCGSGRLVQALRERGVEAYGFDPSEDVVATAPESVRAYLWVGAPGDPIQDRYDVVTCGAGLADPATALAAIAAATDRILLPAGAGPETAGLLADGGFFRDPGVTGRSVVYERRPEATAADVVRAYERALGGAERDRTELERLRAREERATEAMTQSLRLRDLLIVSERALGQVKGELAFLRDQLHGYDELVEYHEAVMASTTWKIGWKAMGPVRKLRRLLGR
jgi:SAM-dependent methyltransferase